LEKASPVLKAVADEIGAAGVTQTAGVAKLSVVGIGMRTHSGVAARLFDLLSSGGFNIQMISTSEIKIAVILDEDRITDAANAVHEGFGLGK
jgi:aspartate kinase